ncbi:O-methyltransferase [Allokutzneria sp. A3M-2-11 16]|uniref:O-methyltransferase n=1 Tax=Allokutzneria sp. A3M-2-11 16 TaxID=2962043 RepID=UPI0020B7A299|nr:O-methyltransferase [Allokutzneria sp. A3M-2-11 16]MCP3803359.1 O-methyltransferase [Allokutzneria sp. A3M-2-11 16]
MWTSTKVDAYFGGLLAPEDEVLTEVVRAATEAGLPADHLSPTQAMLLQVLARAVGARRILEIGTLAGYSAIWMARVLPEGGRLITLEHEPRHARLAEANLARAGLSEVVEVRTGPAEQGLARLTEEGAGPFDLVFIDADKSANAAYLTAVLPLARAGTIIVVDNVVHGGLVADPASTDPDVLGTRAMFDLVAADPRLRSTALQTIGDKGYDGLSITVVDHL